jgi:uncharacterized damage-inducible protein DinB
MPQNKPEVWLRGPLPEIPALLQPVAHTLLQVREELNDLMAGFPDDLLWEKVAGMASPGFHLHHLTGVLNRLFTYARGGVLNQQQLDYLAAEGKPYGETEVTNTLIAAFNNQVDIGLQELSQIDAAILAEVRYVGRAKVPSTVIGLLVHAAEHTTRHYGQLLVTVKVLIS